MKNKNYKIKQCEIKDLKQKLSQKQSKVIEYFMSSNFLFFFFCIYKMYLISTERCKNANVYHLIERKTGEIWASIKDSGSGMCVKNISDLVLKEIHGVLKTKYPTKEQTNEYKMTEREIYEKFDNLSKEELNTKNN